MIQGSLGRRYAKGLFLLALESEREEIVGQELERFHTAYANTALGSVLNNPAFELKSRKQVLLETAKGFPLSPVTTHFLSLLLDRGRLSLLPSIFSAYRRFLDEAKGRVQARLAAPGPVEEPARERIRGVLAEISSKAVVLNVESDPGLIGGAVVEIEGKIYDGSVRTQLRKMQERLEEGS